VKLGRDKKKLQFIPVNGDQGRERGKEAHDVSEKGRELSLLERLVAAPEKEDRKEGIVNGIQVGGGSRRKNVPRTG